MIEDYTFIEIPHIRHESNPIMYRINHPLTMDMDNLGNYPVGINDFDIDRHQELNNIEGTTNEYESNPVKFLEMDDLVDIIPNTSWKLPF